MQHLLIQERRDEINSRNFLIQTTNSVNFALLKKDSYRKRILDSYDTSSKFRKFAMNLKMLYQLYFGNEILSYFHPPLSQRIAWIEGKKA